MSKEAMQQALEALAEQKCPCGDRPADQCPGEWEPGCDLGANPKHAKVAEQAQPVAECIDDICSEHSGRVEAFDHLPAGTKLYTTPPAPVAPPGWRMVPEEPTEEMWLAGLGSIQKTQIQPRGERRWFGSPTHAYKAMLAAAPEAPTQTAPQPLTDEDIEALHKDATGYGLSPLGDERKFARAVEAEIIKRMQK